MSNALARAPARNAWLLAGSLALMSCAPEDGDSAQPVVAPDHNAAGALPVILTDPSDVGLEALVSGRLVRRGSCLFLDTGARSDLIVWGDAVRAVRVGDRGWQVVNETTGERFREGDWLTGEGGSLPESLDIEDYTPEEVPFACERISAVQFHSVRQGAAPTDRAGPPDPPRAPPPPPSIIDSMKAAPERGAGFPVHFVGGIADPREALFAYVIGSYRKSDQFRGRTICLTDAPTELVARLDRRFGEIEPDSACGWKDGGVIHEATSERALFVHARVDCDGRTCAAEGGATYGNVGGEGIGYRMRRRGDGWSLQETGMSWIS